MCVCMCMRIQLYIYICVCVYICVTTIYLSSMHLFIYLRIYLCRPHSTDRAIFSLIGPLDRQLFHKYAAPQQATRLTCANGCHFVARRIRNKIPCTSAREISCSISSKLCPVSSTGSRHRCYLPRSLMADSQRLVVVLSIA